MSGSRWLPLAALLLAVVPLCSAGEAPKPSPFPHTTHARLFTSCAPCHAEQGTDREEELVRVGVTDCARCHDGATVPTVAWRPPVREPGRFKFSHEQHVGREKIACTQCHLAPGATGRMPDMVRPTAETCLACHQASDHLAAEASCSTCHDPVSKSPGLTAEAIAAFPHPPNHEEADFLSVHGGLSRTDAARCAVCHARETCEACHAPETGLDPILALPSDPRLALQAERITPRWQKPADHDEKNWLRHHGSMAGRSDNRCAVCHAQSSCTECHGPTTIQRTEIARLPLTAGSRAGLTPARAGMKSFHPAGFRLGHGPAAAGRSMNCSSCHREAEFCGACHEGTVTSGFHPAGYLNRHAADAYARDTDCAGCHSNEVSCRSCHENAGLAGSDSKSAAYHDAQPFWLLAHGQAARQGLDACTSCHQQTDCLQCHSAKSGWRINPHGEGFDADRLSDQAPQMCSTCHYSDPVPGAGRERVSPR